MSQSQEGQLPKAECYPCCCLAVSALATTTLRLANHCRSPREQFSLHNCAAQDLDNTALSILVERVALEGAILRVETESVCSISSETFADCVPLQVNHQLEGVSENVCLQGDRRRLRSPRHQLFRLQPLEGEEPTHLGAGIAPP